VPIGAPISPYEWDWKTTLCEFGATSVSAALALHEGAGMMPRGFGALHRGGDQNAEPSFPLCWWFFITPQRRAA
jgi:hypothetical protein